MPTPAMLDRMIVSAAAVAALVALALPSTAGPESPADTPTTAHENSSPRVVTARYDICSSDSQAQPTL